MGVTTIQFRVTRMDDSATSHKISQERFFRYHHLRNLLYAVFTENMQAHGWHLPNCTQGVSFQTWFHRAHLKPRDKIRKGHLSVFHPKLTAVCIET